MTGRERFEAVLRHKKPDKMPFFVPTVACTVASELLGRSALGGADSLHFKEELSLFLGKNAHEEFEQQYFEDAVAVARKLRADVIRETWRERRKPSKRIDENTLLFGDPDGGHIVKRFFPETQSYGIIENNYPPATAETVVESVKNYLNEPQPSVSKEDALNGIKGSRAIFDIVRGDSLGEVIPGFGIGLGFYDPAWLEAMALEPDLMREYCMHGLDAAVARMEYLADDGYLFFSGGADLASGNGPMISPALFETIVTEPLRVYAAACEKKNVIYSYKTDGNIEALLDAMFVRTGVQAYGEVDRDAGMTVKKLRKKLQSLIILGNMSSAMLANAAPDEIYTEQTRQLEESEGLNFIPGPSNAVVHGTPVENIFAMIEAVEDFKP